jgi:hypothetical protein
MRAEDISVDSMMCGMLGERQGGQGPAYPLRKRDAVVQAKNGQGSLILAADTPSRLMKTWKLKGHTAIATATPASTRSS